MSCDNHETQENWIKFRDEFDKLGSGIAAGKHKNDADIAMLKGLFTEEEAKFFIATDVDFESASVISVRLGRDPQYVADKLYEMSRKGQLFRQTIDGIRKYRRLPFMHGVAELSIDRFKETPALMYSLRDFGVAGMTATNAVKDPLHRIVPINASTVADDGLLDVDNFSKILDTKTRFAVDDCICATLFTPTPCNYPSFQKRCLSFDNFADYRVENGIGEYITREEVDRMVEQCEKEGTLLCPANSGNVEVACLCCRCFCGLIAADKHFPGPANENLNNYVNQHDFDACKNKCSNLLFYCFVFHSCVCMKMRRDFLGFLPSLSPRPAAVPAVRVQGSYLLRLSLLL